MLPSSCTGCNCSGPWFAVFPHTAWPACLSHSGAALIILSFFLGWALPCPFSGSRSWKLQLLHGSSSSLEDMCCSWVLFHMSVGYNPRNPSPLPFSSVQERSCLLLLVHLPCWAAFHPWRQSIPFRLLFPLAVKSLEVTAWTFFPYLVSHPAGHPILPILRFQVDESIVYPDTPHDHCQVLGLQGTNCPHQSHSGHPLCWGLPGFHGPF